LKASAVRSSGLSLQWKEALALSRRHAPEFYEDGTEIAAGPHADAVRFALTELRLAAVFCVEGVPTIGFLNEPEAPLERIDELHRILWNQGLMCLLLVIRQDELTAYSLAQRPFRRVQGQADDPTLVTTLSLIADALKLRELIASAESGRFWFENDAFFNPENRVDHVLLSNLLEAFRNMRDDLGGDATQALLMQTMFIAYLEDRQIIPTDVFRRASNNACSTLAEMLEARSPRAFESLFIWLKSAFNGNIFNAPCAFETGDRKPPKLKADHLKVLARFRHGREEMASDQIRLWGYDFDICRSVSSAPFTIALSRMRLRRRAPTVRSTRRCFLLMSSSTSFGTSCPTSSALLAPSATQLAGLESFSLACFSGWLPIIAASRTSAARPGAKSKQSPGVCMAGTLTHLPCGSPRFHSISRCLSTQIRPTFLRSSKPASCCRLSMARR
jgi:hypothetical protein